jgi:hypothetical protein
MPGIQSAATSPIFDLTESPALAGYSERLREFPIEAETAHYLEALTLESHPRERARQFAEIFRKLDSNEAVDLFRAAGRSSLRCEPPGIRFLSTFFEVKRPGIEVLHQLEALSSLERVALQVIAGRWEEPEEFEGPEAVYSILEVLEEAGRVGVLELGIDTLPRTPPAIRAVTAHIRNWFGEMRILLESGAELAEELLHYVTQLSMTEIDLMEKRVSRLATIIDPYDVRGMGRLLPVLSRYDQDIAHMKGVVARITTYEPFYERLLTMEHVLSANEMDKLLRALYDHQETTGLGHMVSAQRRNPILDRVFAFWISVAHQVGMLRSRERGVDPPDLHSTMLGVSLTATDQGTFLFRLEKEVGDGLWPTLETWGMLRLDPVTFEMPFREDLAANFLSPDGTPRLTALPEEHKESQLSLKDLIRSQMQNDVFLLGLLDNGKATSMPGVVELIAEQARSLRVLDKICRVKALYTGASNTGVPAALLRNPSRIPINYLRRFVNVRFVSRVDLRQLSRLKGSVRNEVRSEIDKYLASLKPD